MVKADKYIKDTIHNILYNGVWDQNPRPKWKDGTKAYSKFITQQVFNYNISEDEFPITTLRKTALKGAFYDIEAIYIKQTTVIENMHPSIHSWWKDFVVNIDNHFYPTLGQTYGAIINRYDLMNKLLRGLEGNPFGRRNIINMFQYQDQIEDLQALIPCAFETMWSVRELEKKVVNLNASYTVPKYIRYIDLTLIQRSMDFIMTASINPIQYVMLGMMVCNHLTFKIGVEHKLGNFLHLVQNCHIYEKHLEVAKEILTIKPINEQPKIKLTCDPKDFYDHTIDDFEFNIPKGIEKLKNKIELAI